jgi:putative oxidoreductase
MLVAYITADREALFSIFSSPDKFTGAAPYNFLAASLIVLIFGPGRVSVDAFFARRVGGGRASRTVEDGSRVGVQS